MVKSRLKTGSVETRPASGQDACLLFLICWPIFFMVR
jgi:hypothetical protein